MPKFTQEGLLEAREFSALRISLASPEQIESWSYGEVTKPETINYRRLRPEKDGLFCEAIFGPTKDWQCYCGKYKNVRYRGLTCDKCGVEITRSSVRRERMGHIRLAAPVAHVWYTRRVPSYMGLLLDISRRDLDRVLYFAQYVVTYVDEDARVKALKRLEEDLVAEEKRLREEVGGGVDGIASERDQLLSDNQAAIDAINARYEEELATATDKIMKAAQSLQTKIENKVGSKVRAPLVFEPTNTLVVDKGEEVVMDHVTVVQGAATEQLNALQADMHRACEAELADMVAEREKLMQEAERAADEQQDRLQEDLLALRAEAQTRRDEIQSLRQMEFLGENKYRELRARHGQIFKADMGAEAFFEILRGMNLDKLSKELWTEVRETRSKQRRKRATKRLSVVEALRQSGNRPEWMILTILPVIPADLRPMVQLDGGRFATSDLNDLYRRVINRNNRLKRLLELGAPDVIVRNEKRMLQEAVDSLIDNSQRGKALSRRGRRELKSLSDMLKGKKGRFRRNLLGKRVDYSGRSVIVIGPQLKLHQCGLPKTMALELFRPFVISRLVKYNHASNVKGAKRIIERAKPEVWEVLEEVIKERPVMLNRAPTLHRLGIQAFEPVLVEGKAIQIHPLVCTAFNADFDGDQMAVHVPLSEKAVREARELMLSTRNLLKPADGAPIVGPSKDMVLGVYYLTMESGPAPEDSNSVPAYTDLDEVEMAYQLGHLHIHDWVRVTQIYANHPPLETPIVTTVGRCIFNRILPDELRWVNRVLDKREVNELVAACYSALGSEITTDVVDAIKNIGFEFATRSGATISVSDLIVPAERDEIIARTTEEVNQTERDYRRGLMTEPERYQRTVQLWTDAKDEVSAAVSDSLDPYGSISIMAKSGATKGGFGPIAQLAGMRGLMADPSGRIIDLPIRSNFREGLNALEYFISTHGARKGLADTALRTADAGYLTRRLVDVAQDVIVNEYDCGSEGGMWIDENDKVGGQEVYERLRGRVAAGPIAHPETGEIIVERGGLLNDVATHKLEEAGVKRAFVRSPMTCELMHGICALCYGEDLGRGELVEIGSAVGIVAAQSIGEPGTQLTLRTFHTGGIAEARGDITSGLPRVEELFEARKAPKGESVITDIDGVLDVYMRDGIRYVKVIDAEVIRDVYEIPGNWGIDVEEDTEVEVGQRLAFRGEQEVFARTAGRVVREDGGLVIVSERRQEIEYEIPSAARLSAGVETHARVTAGQQLTEGSKNPHRLLQILGEEACRHYLLDEVQKVYRHQGVNINDKHFEIVIRKMLSRVQITRSGDTSLLPGELIDYLELKAINTQVMEQGGQPAAGQRVLLGVTKAALDTNSFLSAASFQHTIKVLARAAIEGKLDHLYGLKENVIIGKLVPAGTGFQYYREQEAAANEEPMPEQMAMDDLMQAAGD